MLNRLFIYQIIKEHKVDAKFGNLWIYRYIHNMH